MEDYIGRIFRLNIRSLCPSSLHPKEKPKIEIEAGGQQILYRSCVHFSINQVEVCFTVNLPAANRRILGDEAIHILIHQIPLLVSSSLFFESLNPKELMDHIDTCEDADAMRDQLEALGLVAFVANGSLLPRLSGVDDSPLRSSPHLIYFQSPPTMEVELKRPNKGPLRGMGFPSGIIIIVGGGYHGKSTLLKALERGIYNHIPGDGREWIVAREDSIKIRSEEGRSIAHVNLSPFINRLPFGQKSESFSTENASGSTSQAANAIEAMEIGTSLFLMDEDTSAANFMSRDERMQSLVPMEKEPITPFIDKIRLLYDEFGVSTILISGCSGDFFDVADHVIMMENFLPREVTSHAKRISQMRPTQRRHEGGTAFGEILNRVPDFNEIFLRDYGTKPKISVPELKSIRYGKRTIDLRHLDQLLENGQTRAIADLLFYCGSKYGKAGISLKEAARNVLQDLLEGGFDILSPFKRGDYALPRMLELSQTINRIRGFKIKKSFLKKMKK